MKLLLTALIDFNHVNDSNQNAFNNFNANAEVVRLVRPDSLLDEIADANGGVRPSLKDFNQNLLPATIHFSNLAFRQRYLNWIYTNYSHSMINQRRVRRIERQVVLTWAEQFNQRHPHLKIVKLATRITDTAFTTRLWIIGYGNRFDRQSFDFQNALDREYHQDYHLSFYNFELNESRQLVANFDKLFNMYLPGANFHFFNNAPTYEVVSKVQPPRFDQNWLQAQQKRSAAAVHNKLKRARSAYDSVAARANSYADRGSQIVSSLKDQTSSALNDYSGISSQLSDEASANVSLSTVNESLKSRVRSLQLAMSGSNQAMLAYKRSRDSLQNQLNGIKNNRSGFMSSQASAQIDALRSSMAARESSYAQESATASQQLGSLRASRSKLASLFDYNQSVYKRQISEITASSASVKMIKWPHASSASSMKSAGTNNSLAQVNASLSSRNAALKSELNYQKAINARSAKDNATKNEAANPTRVTKTKPSRKAFYIPLIIIISIVIIVLLIFVFPLFRF